MDEAYVVEIQAPTSPYIYREGRQMGWLFLRPDADIDDENLIPGCIEARSFKHYRFNAEKTLDVRNEDGTWRSGGNGKVWKVQPPLRAPLLIRNVKQSERKEGH